MPPHLRPGQSFKKPPSADTTYTSNPSTHKEDIFSSRYPNPVNISLPASNPGLDANPPAEESRHATEEKTVISKGPSWPDGLSNEFLLIWDSRWMEGLLRERISTREKATLVRLSVVAVAARLVFCDVWLPGRSCCGMWADRERFACGVIRWVRQCGGMASKGWAGSVNSVRRGV
jgi:hypothetical protein